MSPALILGLVGGLLVLAFLANRLSGLTRIPDVLMLMALGVLLGPVLHLVQAVELSRATNLLGTLAIVLVLFEGGLELDLRNTLRHFLGGFLLAMLAYGLSAGLVALIIHKGLGLPLIPALAVGAVLGCTSSTVVLPVLQQLKASEAVRVTLMLEASWGDVLAVLTVGLLLGLESQHGALEATVLKGLANQVGLAVVFAVPTGILWSRLLPVLSEARFWQVLTFSILLLLYAGMEALDANGLIAVLAFGLTLANFPGVDPRIRFSPLETYVAESQQALLSFHSELAFLVRTFFFVLIGAIAELGIFRHHPLLMLGTLAALFVARWIALQASRWSWREIGPRGRDLILWIMPRGLITIVLALQVAAARKDEVAFLPGLAFAVILLTNLMVVMGGVRASRAAAAVSGSGAGSAVEYEAQVSAAEASSDEGEASEVSDKPTPHPALVAERASKRWILHAGLLLVLALAGLLVWHSKQPDKRGLHLVQDWLRAHFGRGQ
jgi:cell volume regulation protein A